MNFRTLVRSRLATLGYGQKDLARAARVTDSYISQLLTRKKAPPARDRTDIYEKMEIFLRLDQGELGTLAENERAEHIRRKLGQAPEPLFQAFRDLVLGKCLPEKREQVRGIFEVQPFGTLERLVTRTILGIVQSIARRELDGENRIRLAEYVRGRSHEEMRVMVLEFLDTDEFQVSNENCIAFIDPLVVSWDIDLESFRLDIRLNPDLVADAHHTFTFVDSMAINDSGDETGFAEFVDDPRIGGDVTREEIELLRQLRTGGKRPNKLFYYRALQNLRDPLHFFED